MSDSRYSYDDNAEVWPYFALTLVGVVLVPATIMTLVPSTSAAKHSAPAHNHSIRDHRARASRRSLTSGWNLALAGGWAAVAALVYIIRASSADDGEVKAVFDPYEILGVSYTATERQIKSTYRKLSLQFHPDKIRNLGNSTREMIESRYVDITKAYKALTDEVTRDNFLKYGHPDGPQQTSHGIALPKFLVEGSGSPFVVAAYALFVGLVLPYFVGSWWSGARTYTKTGLHQATAAAFFEACAKDQPHFVTHARVLDVLCDAQEYKLVLPGKSAKQIRSLIDKHLHRDFTGPTLTDQFVAVARARTILAGFLDIASAFKDTDLCRRIIDLQRCLVQAVSVDEMARGADLQAQGAASPSEAALSVPRLHVLRAFLRVPGEDGLVPPQSQAHLVLKFVALPQGASVPADFDESLLEDSDEEDHTVLTNPLSTNERDPLLGDAFAPFYPAYARPSWQGFLLSQNQKIIDGPLEMSRLDLSNLALSAKQIAENQGRNLKVSTFKIQMTTATPPFPGKFAFNVLLMSTAYFGCDVEHSFQVEVQNPPPPPQVDNEPAEDEDDDISEPEEDSLAGALAQAKGQKVKSRAKPEPADDSSDEEEDVSDIDTDTEDGE